MAKKAVTERGACIRVACEAFRISESCYRYERKLDAENDEVANWLIRLTDNHRNWGFGLCYLYLRNVKGFKWNHKRVYRIYKELELNLRIKPRKRLVREKPEVLTGRRRSTKCGPWISCMTSSKTAGRLDCSMSLMISTARPLAWRLTSPYPQSV
jgi:hypothetical protein